MSGGLARPTSLPRRLRLLARSGDIRVIGLRWPRSVIEAVGLRPDDWRRWRGLRLAALTQAPGAFAEDLSSWTGGGDTETRWRERLTALPLNVVLTVDGDDAGMVSATAPDAGGRISLVSLWVTPWARGRGVGDVAVHAVLAWAREQGCGDVLASSGRTTPTRSPCTGGTGSSTQVLLPMIRSSG